MKKSMIYTRTGDKGTTSLVGGVRVSKAHARLEAYGTMDELNSHIGELLAYDVPKEDAELLHYVQHKLFSVGSYLATDTSQTAIHVASEVSEEGIERLERRIDEIDHIVPPQTAFILPAGAKEAALCHICRTVCRRGERRILALEEEGICEVDEKVKRFVNRLSDYLFILSRYFNYLRKEPEIYWDQTCK